MNLHAWAIEWGIEIAALDDLMRRMGAAGAGLPDGVEGIGETAIQNRIRVEASRAGCRLWRNNVGAYQDGDRWIRYGLCNDSKQQNARLKSSDLIGIKPITITQRHVGQRVGQFLAREVKAPGWRYTATEREQAQLRFLELVLSFGGDAAFCTGEGSL